MASAPALTKSPSLPARPAGSPQTTETTPCMPGLTAAMLGIVWPFIALWATQSGLLPAWVLLSAPLSIILTVRAMPAAPPPSTAHATPAEHLPPPL